jgi:hypothetical protein
MATPIVINTPATDVTLTLQLSATGLSPGQHTLAYRFLDAAGRWTESSSQIFWVQPPVVATASIGYGEYFFDVDPGYGSGTSFTFTPGVNVNTSFSVPTTSVPIGFHTLQIRFLDQNGAWSETDSKLFVKVQADSVANIARAEYFFDNDPGTGKGTSVSVSNSSTNVTMNPTIPVGGIALNNFHVLNYRFQTQDGKWGLTSSQQFYYTDNKEKFYTPISKVEFHVDNHMDTARLRVDSIGVVMNGYSASAGSIGLFAQDSITKIGRHFVWARGIDYFGTYGKKYNYKEFVVTTDTTTGMLLGQSLNPDSTIMTADSVIIYKDDLGVITEFKGLVVDNTGNFLIGSIPAGTYLFLLKPNIYVSPLAINTYFDQQPQWQMANFQNINADTMFSDVTIKALKTQNLSGLTSLSGNISTDSKKSSGISISPDRTKGRPMKGASVVLVGKNTKGNSAPSNVIASTVTDSLGMYTFNNIPKGDYNIIIDILGVPLIDYYTISVDSTAKAKPNLNYVVGTAGIHVLSVSLPKTNNTLVYPNPSSGEVNILFGNQSGNTSIVVVDMAGRMVYSKTFDVISNSVYTLDLHALGKGLYNMILRNGNSQEVQKIIIQ